MHKSMIKFYSLTLLFNLYLFSSDELGLVPQVKKVKTMELPSQLVDLPSQEELKELESIEQRLGLKQRMLAVSRAFKASISASEDLEEYKKYAYPRQECEASEKMVKLGSEVKRSFAEMPTTEALTTELEGLKARVDEIRKKIKDHYRSIFAGMSSVEIYYKIQEEAIARSCKKSQATSLIEKIEQKCRKEVMDELTKPFVDALEEAKERRSRENPYFNDEQSQTTLAIDATSITETMEQRRKKVMLESARPQVNEKS